MSRNYYSDYDPPAMVSSYGGDGGTSRLGSIFKFLRNRNVRRLVAVLGVGAAVALAYTAWKAHYYSDPDPESDSSVEAAIEEAEAAAAKAKENNNEETVTVVETPEVLEKKEQKLQVTVFQVSRGFFTPAVSPFGLKLETFLRVAKIRYDVQANHGHEQGMESPWVKVGGEEVKSHSECIKVLADRFNIDRCAGASSSRKTAARLVETLLESKVAWGIALWRWVYDEGNSMKDIQATAPQSETILTSIKESVSRAAYYNGIGRKPQEEVVGEVIQALADAAAALGRHPYFLGNSPGEVDCQAFSLFAQMVWNMPGSPFEKAMKQQKPLMEYVTRMRENYWADWDELILHAAIATASMKASVGAASRSSSERSLKEGDGNTTPTAPAPAEDENKNVSQDSKSPSVTMLKAHTNSNNNNTQAPRPVTLPPRPPKTAQTALPTFAAALSKSVSNENSPAFPSNPAMTPIVRPNMHPTGLPQQYPNGPNAVARHQYHQQFQQNQVQQQIQRQQYQQQLQHQLQQQQQLQAQQQFMPQMVQQKMMPYGPAGIASGYNVQPLQHAYLHQMQPQQYAVNRMELLNPLMTPQQIYAKTGKDPHPSVNFLEDLKVAREAVMKPRPQILERPAPVVELTPQPQLAQPQPLRSQNLGGFWM